MNKKINLKYIIVSFGIIISALNINVYAESNENIENNKNNNVEVDKNANENNIHLNESYVEVKKYIEILRNEVTKIDEKLERIKQNEEYNLYPAIRLNIDTPMFGLESVVNQKLKIKDDISAVDVAEGYSIKDIIKNNEIKLTNFTIASNIIISTKNVKIDENITKEDAGKVILKLIEYIKQVESIQDFIDKQSNNIFKGYISKEKLNAINDINSRLNNLSKTLEKVDTMITKLGISNVENDKYNSYISEYNKLNFQIYNLKNEVSSVLITDKKLEECKKDTIKLEEKMIDYSDNIENSFEECKKNINVNIMLKKLKDELTNDKEKIDKYILHSNQDNNENLKDENEDKNQDKESIKYNVSDIDIQNELKGYIDTLNLSISKYENEIDISDQKKSEILDSTFELYNSFISKKYKFYIDNLNLLEKDTEENISNLIKYNSDVSLEKVKYVYIDLPSRLNEMLSINSSKTIIEKENMIIKLKSELDGLLKVNMETTKLCNKLNVNS